MSIRCCNASWKTYYFPQTVQLLGFVISRGHLKIDPEKPEVVTKCPTQAKELHHFSEF